MHSKYKHSHLNALVKLSRVSGLYPECFVLKTIKIDPNPVAHGGFADIYKGDFLGQEVGIKQLKVYQKSDIEKLLKVMLMYAIFDNVKWVPFPGIVFCSCHLETTVSSQCATILWHLSTTQKPTKGLPCVSLDGKWELVTFLD